MKWTPEQIEELRSLCFSETPNKTLAAHFHVPVPEIHAKRSQLGITRSKVAAAKAPVSTRPNDCADDGFDPYVYDGSMTPEGYEAMHAAMEADALEGLETFVNGGSQCIVLARDGEKALICMPNNPATPFVVPFQHIPGARDWWQGHYFSDLSAAWEYFNR